MLRERPNQLERQRAEVSVTAHDRLPTWRSTPGEITEAGLRSNVSVGFQYISFWLSGPRRGGINNLMEDAATAEISRSQIWQWVHHGVDARGRPHGHPRAGSAGARRGDSKDPRAGGRSYMAPGKAG